MKLAMVILDAMEVDFLRAIGSEKILSHYREKGDILTVSRYPHTQDSNLIIWAGRTIEKPFWMCPDSAQANQFARIMRGRMGGHLDPAVLFDRDSGETTDSRFELLKRSDFDFPFIWDFLGNRAEGVQIPIVLPPYSYNAHRETEAWFPDSRERQYKCNREKTEIAMESLGRMAEDTLDFFCTSLPSYDKLLHGLAEGHFGEDFVRQECMFLDEWVDRFVSFCENNEIHYALFGDHGSPKPGVIETQTNFSLPMHGKHTIIISDLDPMPRYTDEIFDWMCDLMGIGTEERRTEEEKVKIKSAVEKIPKPPDPERTFFRS